MSKMSVAGLEEVRRRLRALGPEIAEKAVKAGLARAATELKKVIIAASPVDDETQDGTHIKDNIQAARSRRRSGPGREVFTVAVKYGKHKATVRTKGVKRTVSRLNRGKAFYWQLVEFGTSKMTKKPFMGPAFVAAVPKLRQTIIDNLRAAVARAEKKKG